MSIRKTAAVLFVVSLAAASLFAAPSAFALDGKHALAALGAVATHMHHWIAKGYKVAPALMLGIAVLAAIPFLALTPPLVAWLRRPKDATQRYQGGTSGEVTGNIDGEDVNVPSQAFLEVVGPSPNVPGRRFAILHDMLRIGREDDNDIRIPSGAVHRDHAAITREDFDDWRITDLSGIDGNGIAVNGQRCSDARLHDGDVIQLGPGKLRFRAAYA